MWLICYMWMENNANVVTLKVENVFAHWTRSPDRSSWKRARCGWTPPWWRCSWSRRWCIPWGSGGPGCGSGRDHALMSERWWTNALLLRETMRRWSRPASPDRLLDWPGNRVLGKKRTFEEWGGGAKSHHLYLLMIQKKICILIFIFFVVLLELPVGA